MAFSLIDLKLVIRLRLQGYIPDSCAVAEVGAQQLDDSILDSKGDLPALGKAFKATRPCPILAVERPTDARHRLIGMPMSRQIWQWVGLRYLAIDIDGSPDSIPLDLNYDDVPEELKGKHHLVTNFGTTEHVANQLNAFKIVHDLAAAGGIMIHNLPRGQPNHGLVNYNPKFFWQLARANDYRELYTRPTDADHGGILVALQKQHALEFTPPLDVEKNVTAPNDALRQRYWTIYDQPAMDAIAYSKENDLLRYEETLQLKESELERREYEAYVREQRVDAREEAAHGRERDLYRREQAIDAREQAIRRREAGFMRRLRIAIGTSAPWLVALKRKLVGSAGRSTSQIET